jgi:hypothetical protein
MDWYPHRGRGAVRSIAWGALFLFCYGLQVTLGYLLMLVAMTYQVELFIMVPGAIPIGPSWRIYFDIASSASLIQISSPVLSG